MSVGLPLQDVADRGVRRCAAPGETESRIQFAAMYVDEGDDTTIGVAAGHHGQNGNSHTCNRQESVQITGQG